MQIEFIFLGWNLPHYSSWGLSDAQKPLLMKLLTSVLNHRLRILWWLGSTFKIFFLPHKECYCKSLRALCQYYGCQREYLLKLFGMRLWGRRAGVGDFSSHLCQGTEAQRSPPGDVCLPLSFLVRCLSGFIFMITLRSQLYSSLIVEVFMDLAVPYCESPQGFGLWKVILLFFSCFFTELLHQVTLHHVLSPIPAELLEIAVLSPCVSVILLPSADVPIWLPTFLGFFPFLVITSWVLHCTTDHLYYLNFPLPPALFLCLPSPSPLFPCKEQAQSRTLFPVSPSPFGIPLSWTSSVAVG